MKPQFLGLALLCPTLSFAFDNPADSILVKVGKRASVTFFGEKKADLKSLERYDWNAIVRDMNARLGLTTPAEPRQHYVDLLGNSYLADSSLRKGGSVVKTSELEADQPVTRAKIRSDFQNLRNQVQFGFSVSWLSPVGGLLPRNPYPTTTWYDKLIPTWSDELSLRSGSGRRYAINFLRNTVLKKVGTRQSFLLQWGGEFSLHRLRTDEPIEYLNIDGSSDFSDGEVLNNTGGKVVTLPGYGKFLRQPIAKKTYNATYFDVVALPTLRFYNSAGQRTFQIGLGPFLGYRLGHNERTVYETTQSTRYADKRVAFLPSYPPFHWGAALTVGYRNLSVSTRYEFNSFGFVYEYRPRLLSIGVQISTL